MRKEQLIVKILIKSCYDFVRTSLNFSKSFIEFSQAGWCVALPQVKDRIKA